MPRDSRARRGRRADRNGGTWQGGPYRAAPLSCFDQPRTATPLKAEQIARPSGIWKSGLASMTSRASSLCTERKTASTSMSCGHASRLKLAVHVRILGNYRLHEQAARELEASSGTGALKARGARVAEANAAKHKRHELRQAVRSGISISAVTNELSAFGMARATAQSLSESSKRQATRSRARPARIRRDRSRGRRFTPSPAALMA